VTMLRQPESRLVSMYLDQNNTFTLESKNEKDNILDYAYLMQGAVVKQLTFNTVDGMLLIPATERDAEKAVLRLKEGFVFVGITEEWNLSICLLHAMFGGQCQASEFENDRPGEGPSAERSLASQLNGFSDKLDGQVYEAGLSIFHKNLKVHNVSLQSCQACFAAAGLTAL